MIRITKPICKGLIKKVKQALAHGEGCRVYGVLDVQRVAGNFHISVHGLNIFVAQMIFGGNTHVNVSHIIHDLSFGPKYPGIHNPLDGTERIPRGESGTFKYYIKIVPTEYSLSGHGQRRTPQFSALYHSALCSTGWYFRLDRHAMYRLLEAVTKKNSRSLVR
ncbi:hypothetical protein K7X08_011950 [Anisodus acutangulus]|uniref:Endoplasmic reticulum vesicle transporter C-terminal domain-containing protein n=1 Tax=Anisodus acutangulus TaxID=402998 RepID=A0A9Q1QY58_9SOLA|nr:hypothetical protein K7X08_011950 [Anisodus acutangulus]